jgi:hypothetical protein
MNRENILKDLGIFIFNKTDSKNASDIISPLIYKTLAYGKGIPKKAYSLIHDKRYHKEFPIVAGFKWHLSKLKDPPFYIILALIKKLASELTLPFIDEYAMINLIFHTLIIDFFEENPKILE